jgi:uncharacterized protein YabN with tetrapyrrole methylase and pyrophosphatase domain
MITTAASGSVSLVVVGLGINVFGQLTVESIAHMKNSQKLLYLGVEPVGEALAKSLNPEGFESLLRFYADGKDRSETYDEITDFILTHVRAGRKTCVAVYGHPGVFASPTHRAIKTARTEGFGAIMLPAISAEDCLIADLGIDPASNGLASFEATDFLVRGRKPDPTVGLLLWQVGVVGLRTTGKEHGGTSPHLPLLVERLLQTYPAGHLVTLYEAATLPGTGPVIDEVPLIALTRKKFSSIATLYIPPSKSAEVDLEMIRRISPTTPSPEPPTAPPKPAPPPIPLE